MTERSYVIQDFSDEKGTVSNARQISPSNGKENKPAVIADPTSTNITIAAAADNTIYKYGELTNLTVTAIPANGDFIIRFTSGATPTTTSFPASMVFQSAFVATADTRYEISVSDGYAVVGEWPVASA